MFKDKEKAVSKEVAKEKVVKAPVYSVKEAFTYKGKFYKVNSNFSGSLEDVAKVKKYLS